MRPDSTTGTAREGLPSFRHQETDPRLLPHVFGTSAQHGCVISGVECPSCGWINARILHLDPPSGALVACLGATGEGEDRRVCGHEWPVVL